MATEPPDGNVELQYKWSAFRSENVQKRQRRTVDLAAGYVKDRFGPGAIEDVLVIGPQHGYELSYWKEYSRNVVGLDPVPQFVTDCREMGHACVHGYAEELTQYYYNNEVNICAVHTLEHCYDRRLAIEQIKLVMKQWCFIAVPIEPGNDPPKDEAHLSPVRSVHELLDEFKPLRLLQSDTLPSGPNLTFSEYRCLFAR